jgi:hypothetical protein
MAVQAVPAKIKFVHAAKLFSLALCRNPYWNAAYIITRHTMLQQRNPQLQLIRSGAALTFLSVLYTVSLSVGQLSGIMEIRFCALLDPLFAVALTAIVIEASRILGAHGRFQTRRDRNMFYGILMVATAVTHVGDFWTLCWRALGISPL